ncbi:PAS domain-containing protein [Celeribacter sp.]|uniref:PAS domain-containing protein n=1 Tax=Celeribacter sp. TaxID=1890673 RepID=UPI003A8EDDC7
MTIDYLNGSNVVSLMPRRAEQQFSAIKEVEAYWERLRNGRPVPSRAEIDPRGMQNALEYAFILERIAPGVARFRLAGMHLTDLMGMEVRGMPLTAMLLPEARKQMSEVLEAVCQTPQVTTLTLKSARGIGRAPLEAKLLLCPLKSDFGDVNRVLGCLQAKGEIGRQPRRFDILEVGTRPLLTDELFPADLPPVRVDLPKMPVETAPAKTEGASANKGDTQDKPRVPFLRLVADNDA